MALLSWRGVTKSYRDRTVVDAVSLDVEPGEILGLLGPSGSGKSTLLRVAAGLERPEAGGILLDGRDVTGEPPHRRGIGLMFQDYCLFPHMSAGDNVGFGLRMLRWPRGRRADRVEEMLRLVKMQDQAARGVVALSGGEQQRVALARSLAPAPRVLMLDEPLGALDARLRGELLDELRRILGQVGTTAVYVTHDRGEALALCSRIAVMDAGRIEQVATPSTLVGEPASGFVASFLGLGVVVPARAKRSGSQWCAATSLGEMPVAMTSAAGADPADSPADERPGARSWVLVRPSAVRLSEATGLQRAAARIAGYVVAANGTSVRLALLGAGGEALGAGPLECPLRPGETTGAVGAVGDQRSVWLSPGSCLLLPR